MEGKANTNLGEGGCPENYFGEVKSTLECDISKTVGKGAMPAEVYAQIQMREREQMICLCNWKSSVWLQHGVGNVVEK